MSIHCPGRSSAGSFVKKQFFGKSSFFLLNQVSWWEAQSECDAVAGITKEFPFKINGNQQEFTNLASDWLEAQL